MEVVAPEVQLLDKVQRLPRLHDEELLRKRDALTDFGWTPTLTVLGGRLLSHHNFRFTCYEGGIIEFTI